MAALLQEDIQLLDELDALPSRHRVVGDEAGRLRRRLHQLCVSGCIEASPEEIEVAVQNHLGKRSPTQAQKIAPSRATSPFVQEQPLIQASSPDFKRRTFLARWLPWLPPKSGLPRGFWKTHRHRDDLTQRPIVDVSTRSLNAFRLRFPYGGRQRMRLRVQIGPEDQVRIWLDMRRGQFAAYDSGHSVSCCFDAGDRHAFTVLEAHASGRDRPALVIADPSRFLDELRASQEVRIRVPLYGNDPIVFVFRVTALPERMP